MDDAKTLPSDDHLSSDNARTLDHATDDDARVLAPRVRAVLDLFSRALQDVAFPGVDGRALSLAREQVMAAHADVVSARAALAAREATLEHERAALTRLTERAVAYARVYADGEGDHALTSALDALPSLSTARARVEAPRETPTVKKRRGRPPAAVLPLDGDAHALAPVDEPRVAP